MSYPPLSGPYPSKTEKDLFLFFSNSSYCEFSSVHVNRNGSKDGEGPLFQNFPGWWDVNLKTKPHRITGKRHMLLPAGFPCLGIISWNCIGTYWVLSWLVSSCWICRGTTRMLCFSTRLRPTRSESTVTRHFLGILRLESEFKGNIGGIPSHSITWLQDVAKGCSLGMQPTIVRKPLMKPGCSSEGYVCDYLVHAPRVQCVGMNTLEGWRSFTQNPTRPLLSFLLTRLCTSPLVRQKPKLHAKWNIFQWSLWRMHRGPVRFNL